MAGGSGESDEYRGLTCVQKLRRNYILMYDSRVWRCSCGSVDIDLEND
jgi:hypothetical protein